jgi:hypothetical protein
VDAAIALAVMSDALATALWGVLATTVLLAAAMDAVAPAAGHRQTAQHHVL